MILIKLNTVIFIILGVISASYGYNFIHIDAFSNIECEGENSNMKYQFSLKEDYSLCQEIMIGEKKYYLEVKLLNSREGEIIICDELCFTCDEKINFKFDQCFKDNNWIFGSYHIEYEECDKSYRLAFIIMTSIIGIIFVSQIIFILSYKFKNK